MDHMEGLFDKESDNLAWFKFCCVGPEWPSLLRELSEINHGQELWGHQNHLLQKYIVYTFEACYQQQKLQCFDDREGTSLTAFNTGLVTRAWEEIFCVFRPSASRSPEWEVRGFFRESTVREWGLLSKLERPMFFDDPSALVLDLRREIRPDFEKLMIQKDISAHLRVILGVHMSRAEQLEKLTEAFDRARYMCRVHYRTPVPQFGFHYDQERNLLQGRLGFLLPLYLTDQACPDLVLMVVRVDQVGKVAVYTGCELLLAEVAYCNARLLGKVESEWLRTAIAWIQSRDAGYLPVSPKTHRVPASVVPKAPMGSVQVFTPVHSVREGVSSTPGVPPPVPVIPAHLGPHAVAVEPAGSPLYRHHPIPHRHPYQGILPTNQHVHSHSLHKPPSPVPSFDPFKFPEADLHALEVDHPCFPATNCYVDNELVAPLEVSHKCVERVDAVAPVHAPFVWREQTPTPPIPSPTSSPTLGCEEKPGVTCNCRRPDHYYTTVKLTDVQRSYIRYVVVSSPHNRDEQYTIGIRYVCESKGAQQLVRMLEGNVAAEYKKGASSRLCASVPQGQFCPLGTNCPDIHVTPEGWLNKRPWTKAQRHNRPADDSAKANMRGVIV